MSFLNQLFLLQTTSISGINPSLKQVVESYGVTQPGNSDSYSHWLIERLIRIISKAVKSGGYYYFFFWFLKNSKASERYRLTRVLNPLIHLQCILFFAYFIVLLQLNIIVLYREQGSLSYPSFNFDSFKKTWNQRWKLCLAGAICYFNRGIMTRVCLLITMFAVLLM